VQEPVELVMQLVRDRIPRLAVNVMLMPGALFEVWAVRVESVVKSAGIAVGLDDCALP
jgi:hypothetical protein